MAHAIHGLSGRAEKPFVSVNCGALTETLLESELFGHVKCAFTDAAGEEGAVRGRDGTLFDEVAEVACGMQVKLLRALQERASAGWEARRRPRWTCVLTATNAPLEEYVKQKRFREDLFYRLQVIPIVTPPLRERREDIPLLAQHFTQRFARQMGKGVAKVSQEAHRSCARSRGRATCASSRT